MSNPIRSGVDVLDSAFVDAYADKTGAQVFIQPFGANTCRQLGRDLSKMYKNGLLERGRIGLGFNWQHGFPKWVYSYHLPD